MKIELTDIDAPELRDVVSRRLTAFSAAALGMPGDKQPLAVLLRDAEGAVEGGIWGHLRFGWLQLEFTIVPPHLRGEGVGAALLGAIERAAVERGAYGVRGASFDFQAAGFFRRHGYIEYARLEDHPPGHHEVAFYKKAGLGAGDDGRAVETAPDPVHRETLQALLLGHNAEQAGPPETRPVGVALRDADGAVLGGLVGYTGWRWLHVAQFALPDGLRHGGWGTRIMTVALDEARARGMVGAKLGTGSYHARPFYERLGFRVYGEIADYLPGGHARFLMAQRLDR